MKYKVKYKICPFVGGPCLANICLAYEMRENLRKAVGYCHLIDRYLYEDDDDDDKKGD